MEQDFQSITGADTATARSFIARAGGNLELALSNFFEAGIEVAAPPPPIAPPPRQPDAVVAMPLRADDDDVVAVVNRATQVPLPLVGLKAHVVMYDLVADVTAEMRFVNESPDTLEASFVFRNDDVAICGFSATMGGRTVVGVVQDKAAARARYAAAMQDGDAAAILEQGAHEGGLVLQLGNLLAGQSAIVSLRYVADLKLAGDSVELLLSLARTPLREVAHETDAAATARVPSGLKVTADVTMASAITQLTSTSHGLGLVQPTPERALVSVQDPFGGSPAVLRLLVTIADPTVPRLAVQHSPAFADDALRFTIVPDLGELAATLSEVIFVVDRSGSMAGSRIRQARNALQLFLRALPMGTLFNIYGFGSRWAKLFPESRAYSDATMRQARDYIAAIQADMAQTDILPPLRDALGSAANPRYARQLLVLTDGEVPNTSEVLRYARDAAADTRIFTFGIGAEASRTLVKGLATAGRGQAEFVLSGERIEPVVARQLARCLQPVITNARMDWGRLGAHVLQSPATLPPIFSGEPFTVFALVAHLDDPAAFGTEPVALVGEVDGERFTLSLELSLATDTFAGELFHRLAARAIVRDLERGAARPGPPGVAAKRKLINIATTYSLLSAHTSFVAVAEADAAARRAVIRSVLVTSEVDAAEAADQEFRESGAPVPMAIMRDSAPVRVGGYGGLPALVDDGNRHLELVALEEMGEVTRAMTGELSRVVHEQGSHVIDSLDDGESDEDVRASESRGPQKAKAKKSGAGGGFFGWVRGLGGSSATGAAPPPPPPAEAAAAPPPPPPGAAAGGGGAGQPAPNNDRLSASSVSQAARAPPPAAMSTRAASSAAPAPAPAPAPARDAKRAMAPSLARRREADASHFAAQDDEMEEVCDPFAALSEAEPVSEAEPAAEAAPPESEAELVRFDDGSRGIDQLVMLQNAAGAWLPTAALSRVCGVDVAVLLASPAAREHASASGMTGDVFASAFATALVLALLPVRFAAEADEWALIARKAKRWLASVVAGADALIALARSLSQ